LNTVAKDDCILSMDNYLNLINPLNNMTPMTFITPEMSAIIDPQLPIAHGNSNMLDLSNGPSPFGHLTYNPGSNETISNAEVQSSSSHLAFANNQQQQQPIPHISTDFTQPHNTTTITTEHDSRSNSSFSQQQPILSASSNTCNGDPYMEQQSQQHQQSHIHHMHHIPTQPMDMYGMMLSSQGGHHFAGMSFLSPNGHIAPAAEEESMFGGSIMVPMLNHGAVGGSNSLDTISPSATNGGHESIITGNNTTLPTANTTTAAAATTSGKSKSKKKNNSHNIGPDGQPIKPERKRKEPAKINTEIVQKQIELMLSNNVFLANKAAAAAVANNGNSAVDSASTTVSTSVSAAVAAAMATTSTTNSSSSSLNNKQTTSNKDAIANNASANSEEGGLAGFVNTNEGEDVSKCPKRHRGFGASAKIFNEDGTMEVGGKKRKMS
jgi:hypothetical protein